MPVDKSAPYSPLKSASDPNATALSHSVQYSTLSTVLCTECAQYPYTLEQYTVLILHDYLCATARARVCSHYSTGFDCKETYSLNSSVRMRMSNSEGTRDCCVLRIVSMLLTPRLIFSFSFELPRHSLCALIVLYTCVYYKVHSSIQRILCLNGLYMYMYMYMYS